MERIGVEDARQNLANIIKRVEAGEEIMLTRYGKDIAHISSPDMERVTKKRAFFSLLGKIKEETSVNASPDEIREWIEEGRA